MLTLKRYNDHPRLDQRLDETKQDLANQKEIARQKEKLYKSINMQSQQNNAEIIKLKEETRKIKDMLNNDLKTK